MYSQTKLQEYQNRHINFPVKQIPQSGVFSARANSIYYIISSDDYERIAMIWVNNISGMHAGTRIITKSLALW